MDTVRGWFGGKKGKAEYANIDAYWLGYGNVNTAWKDPESLIDACAKYGVALAMVEASGWAKDKPTVDQAMKAIAKLIKAARKANVWAFVKILNSNDSLSKHGNKPVSEKDSLAMGNGILKQLLSAGPEGVIVNPVGECRTAYHHRFEADAGAQLQRAGFRTVWNHGSRPVSAPAGWWSHEYHPNKAKDDLPNEAINVTDTSGIIADLSAGGTYAQAFSPKAVVEYVKRMELRKIPTALYGFCHPVPDEATLRVLCDAGHTRGKPK